MAIESTPQAAPQGSPLLDKDRLQYKYLFGDCHTLTVALHELTGWPCAVFRDMSDPFEGQGLILHSAVESAGTRGVYLDAAGRRVILVDMARRYNVEVSDLSQEAVTIEFMNEEFGVTDDGVAAARQYSQAFLSGLLPARGSQHVLQDS